jgi:hypothetical protein
MSDAKKLQHYQRVLSVLHPFFEAGFKSNFNSSVWLRSANSRKSIDEGSGAENYSEYSFLGKEVDELDIDTWLEESDDSAWLARLNLRFNVNLAGLSVRFFAVIHGNKLVSIEMEDEDYNALSFEQMDSFRKAVVTHYGLLRPLT